MLVELSQNVSEALKFILASTAYTTASQLIAFSLGLWIFWRLWSFTILPALRPDAPKELPYWIPGQLPDNLLHVNIR